ncbi:hypothetical protein FACS1894110_19270 [Spirochaetia bacterium]|nr:hypothetical protein FACS1894110_19270 [Spirochaetia bacterium]
MPEKNRRQRTVYVKITLAADKDGNLAKEPWDSSTEKAKALTIEDFGTLDEVKEMAKGPFTNKTGLIATLSKTSINKILNNKAKNQSFNEEAHILAAVNVDRLFFNAIEPWKFELDPRKENTQLNNRMFFYSPMEFDGNGIPE